MKHRMNGHNRFPKMSTIFKLALDKTHRFIVVSIVQTTVCGEKEQCEKHGFYAIIEQLGTIRVAFHAFGMPHLSRNTNSR